MPHAPFTRIGLALVAGALTVFSTDCTSNSTFTTVDGVPAALAITAGDAQSGPVAQALPTSITVKVTDAAGNGQGGVEITWAVTSGGGSVGARKSTTDASGQGSTTWTLGPTAGDNSATATVTGLPLVTFRATGTPGPAAALAFSTSPTSVVAGTAFAPPVVVLEQDAHGNAVAAAYDTVRLTIASGTGTAGATLSGATSAVTDSAGARFANLRIDKAGTGYRLSARATGRTAATSGAVTVTAAAAALVTKQAGDGDSAAVGTAVSPRPAVLVQDSFANPVPGVAVTFAVTSGGGSVSGASQTTGASGVATVGGWTLGGTAGTNTLTATVAGSGITGSPATFTAIGTSGGGGVAAPALVTKQAGDGDSAAVGTAVSPRPAVLVQDSFANPVPGVAVTFAVASGGGSVSGASQTTGANGVATVGGWTLGGTAGTNTLTATVAGSGITGNPATFTAFATSGGGPSPTVLFAENYEDANLASRGWYDLPAGGIQSITTAEHAPGDTASLEVDYVQGQTGPVPAVGARHLFTPSNSVYLRYWVKYSTNWVGSGVSYDPHEITFLTNLDAQYAGPAWDYLTIYVQHNYQNGGYAWLETQDGKNIDTSQIGVDLTNITENRAVSGCNGTPDSTADMKVICYQAGSRWNNGKTWSSAQPVFSANPSDPGYKANWHEVEAYFQLNSIVNGIGQQDGIAQYWFDGQLVIDRHNVLFRTGAHPTMQFNQMLFQPYIGVGSPVNQKMWINNLVVMTARP